jgi:hypothetical protein
LSKRPYTEKDRQRKRVYYERNRERIITAVRARSDPEAKREYDRAYSERPEVRARRAAQRRRWNQRNQAKAAAHNKSNSLKRRGHRFFHAAREYVAVLLGDPCVYCGKSCEHIDHIDPINTGGGSTWDNLTAACATCNYHKRDLPLLAFLAR